MPKLFENSWELFDPVFWNPDSTWVESHTSQNTTGNIKM